MIQTVIRLGNNMVMVFDAEGEQIPEYQGQYENVMERILRDAPSGAILNHWFGREPDPEAVFIKGW